MKALTFCLLATLLFQARAASYLGPEVGDAAPTLAISKWLQRPREVVTGWPSGKIVVLEFWATWCAPCVQSIPHLNELADHFKDKPLQFIAVTDQDENIIGPFLKKTPIHAWVGLMSNSISGENNPYHVYGIPHTVIIDAQGRVAAVTDPRSLTVGLLERCLAGKPLSPAAEAVAAKTGANSAELDSNPDVCPEPGAVPGQSAIGRTPMFQVLIRPHGPAAAPATGAAAGTNAAKRSVETSFHYSRSDIALSMPGGQLRDAIQSVFQVDRMRVALETNLPIGRFDFYISLSPRNVADGGRMLQTVFSEAVLATFGLTIKRETRETDVFILRTNATSLAKLAKSTNNGRKEIHDYLGEVTAVNRTLGDLASGLRNAIRRPVLDETGVTNTFSYSVKWEQNRDHPDPEKMTAAVNELGLEIIADKRPVEFVVVRPAEK